MGKQKEGLALGGEDEVLSKCLVKCENKTPKTEKGGALSFQGPWEVNWVLAIWVHFTTTILFYTPLLAHENDCPFKN